jgi:hypothetical protein
MRSLLVVIPFLWACTGDGKDSQSSGGDDSASVDDSSTLLPTDDTSDTEDDLGCDELEITYDGPFQPHVGDQWILQLWCDGALMTLTVIRFIPSDFASLDENVATFLMPGEGTIQMQAGTDREYLDVTVLK